MGPGRKALEAAFVQLSEFSVVRHFLLHKPVCCVRAIPPIAYEEGQYLIPNPLHDRMILRIAFAPNGHFLAVCSKFQSDQEN